MKNLSECIIFSQKNCYTSYTDAKFIYFYIKKRMNIYIPIINNLKDIFNLEYQITSIISEYVSGYVKEDKSDGYLKELDRYQKHVNNLKDCIFSEYKSFKSETFENILPDISSIQSYINEKKDKITEKQSSQRFSSVPEDHALIISGKFIKRFFLKLHWFWIGPINWFRRLFKADLLVKEYWVHSIPEKRIAELVYHIECLEQLYPVFSQLLEFRKDVLSKSKLADEALEKIISSHDSHDINDVENEIQIIQKEIVNRKKNLDKYGKKIWESLNHRFEIIKSKTGTFEFPLFKLRVGRLKRKKRKILKKYSKNLNNFHIKVFALFEHWRKKIEARHLLIETISSCEEKKSLLYQKISDLVPEFEKIAEPIQAAINGIEKNTLNTDMVRNNYLNHLMINKNLPDLHNAILDKDLHEPFDSFLSYVNIKISELDGQCLFPLKSNIDKLKKPAQLKKIDIKNIITGKANEYLDNSIISERLKFTRKIQKIHNSIEEITQVIEYSLEYYFTNLKSEKPNESEFLNGIKRALRKAEENLEILHQLKDNTPDKLSEITEIFIRELRDSLMFEHLYKTERKALREKYFDDKKLFLIHTYRVALQYSKRGISKTREVLLLLRTRYLNLRSILGITTEKKSISSELSNYLADTETAFSQLPLMYQRLFKIEPLTDQKFLIERGDIMDQINNAYENWKKGKYAPACLVGEPGSGITTIINVFSETIGNEIDIYRFNLETRITTGEDYFNLMQQIFAEIKFKNLDELYSALADESYSRRIVILENIQKLFIRKNNGFTNLLSFFKLISKSNQKVFWITSCLLYSYNYLNYTHHFSDYFGHIIGSDLIDDEKLEEMILKRHKPSGFDMNFLPPVNFRPRRSFKKLSEEGKQVFLKNNFLKRLNDITKGNLSLTYILWLRSVIKVTDDCIYFQFNQLDYSFLDSLGDRKITSLHAILLHEGLSQKEHMEVMGCSESESISLLMLMSDDSILIKTDDKYTINPLLYRYIVDYLHSLNFIH